jgi:hypothetical protein
MFLPRNLYSTNPCSGTTRFLLSNYSTIKTWLLLERDFLDALWWYLASEPDKTWDWLLLLMDDGWLRTWVDYGSFTS